MSTFWAFSKPKISLLPIITYISIDAKLDILGTWLSSDSSYIPNLASNHANTWALMWKYGQNLTIKQLLDAHLWAESSCESVHFRILHNVSAYKSLQKYQYFTINVVKIFKFADLMKLWFTQNASFSKILDKLFLKISGFSN